MVLAAVVLVVVALVCFLLEVVGPASRVPLMPLGWFCDTLAFLLLLLPRLSSN